MQKITFTQLQRTRIWEVTIFNSRNAIWNWSNILFCSSAYRHLIWLGVWILICVFRRIQGWDRVTHSQVISCINQLLTPSAATFYHILHLFFWDTWDWETQGRCNMFLERPYNRGMCSFTNNKRIWLQCYISGDNKVIQIFCELLCLI